MKLPMSEGEIVREYKAAADKNKQVNILADLNVCTKDEILQILVKRGAISGLPKKKRRPPIKWTEEMLDEIRQLYGNGKSAQEIADFMGLEETQVKNKINRSKMSRTKQAVPLAARPENGPEAAPEHHACAEELVRELARAYGIADCLASISLESLTYTDNIVPLAVTLRDMLRRLYDDAADFELFKLNMKKRSV